MHYGKIENEWGIASVDI